MTREQPPALAAAIDEAPTPLEAALDYAGRGWKVLPLVHTGPKAKAPAVRRGFHAATTDPAQIRQWWKTRPSALVGLVVPPGVVVLDIDPRNGGTLADLEAVNGDPLPATRTVRTGFGGLHLWFLTRDSQPLAAHPQGVDGRPLVGIDVKAAGRGYVVAPPSRHPSTGLAYTWENPGPVLHCPRRLYAALRREQAPARTRTPASAQSPRARRDDPSTAPGSGRPPSPDGLIRWYRTTTHEGERNERLYRVACRLLEEGHPPQVLDRLADAARDLGLEDVEVGKTIISAMERHYAKTQGAA
ncbi:bifunctional DNA primase/polymerase [Actinomyces culturomici]|uniref:bifunctional DNA primase/polymerase n=1 Tax=Actinomyces culturomici TaxID=1926276 RepID=UPI000E204AC3|nr:bifunctional DNA primase/polymerase [Actinomyces culturomici]